MLIQTGEPNHLLEGLQYESQVWMSHSDSILKVPEGSTIIGTTASIPVAAFQLGTHTHGYGIQFHPEVYHSTEGSALLSNFVFSLELTSVLSRQ